MYIDWDGKAPGCPGPDAVIVEGATASLVACKIKVKVVGQWSCVKLKFQFALDLCLPARLK